MILLFSYSHRDEEFRKELETHLAMLKRDGVITTWHDRRIAAGSEIDSEINEYLESAEIILLLVSAYFLESDYCYNIEMRRAMEKHEAGEVRVIPVILHPCDWKSAPFGKLRATPLDGKPVSTFTNRHEAFYSVAMDIRRAAEQLLRQKEPAGARVKSSVESNGQAETQARNLRVRREFSDREKDDFLHESYVFIARFFENSLRGLEAQNAGLETRFRRVDASQFTAAVYVGGKKRANCRVWLGGRGRFGGDIAYSTSDELGDNSFNESLSVTDDGYSVLLKPLGMASFGRMRNQQLTQQGAAEYLWSIFIEPLQ